MNTVDGKGQKTVVIDESKPVKDLMVTICTKMGLSNHDEYSLVREQALVGAGAPQQQPNRNSPSSNGYGRDENDAQNGKNGAFMMNTIGRRKERQVQQLKAKLHTDENVAWLDPNRSLREQEVGEREVLTLRRKFFVSDTNVDTRDPAQLNMLYAQCRNGVLDGTHPVSRDIAIQLAALQCYIEYGPYQEGVERQLK